MGVVVLRVVTVGFKGRSNGGVYGGGSGDGDDTTSGCCN